MCGIAGVLSQGDDPSVPVAAASRMQRALAHRGPDDRGSWTSARGTAVFAHTRLSIIDLSPAGHQPMTSADGRLTITFNGEIYNYEALRTSLQQRGAIFRTGSDTEVILHAYAYDGVECFSQLRGMFALAIWDEASQTCILARDRFGIKPFYYHATADRLVFASEVRALLRSGLVPAELDAEGVYGFLRSGSVPEPATLLRNVRCLAAGHYAVWTRGELTAHPFWRLVWSDAGASDEEAVAATRAALIDSVHHHFISDTQVGVFLSGGLDSTVMVALARAAGIEDLATFSIAFPGEPGDEGPIAKATAESFRTQHTEWAVDEMFSVSLFSEFLQHMDQPSVDGLNTLAVSRVARGRGVKAVISGLGGDELFGGYPSFRQVPRLARLHRSATVAGPLAVTAGAALERFAPQAKLRRMGDLLQQPPGVPSAYGAFRAVFTRREARALLRRYDLDMREAPEAADAVADDPTPEDSVSRMEMTKYMRNQLLRDADTMSMAYGLELRVPFLDGPLLDLIAAVPARIRLQDRKGLLRAAVPEIPEHVARQPKRGFLFPMARWTAAWQPLFEHVERTSVVPLENWYRKWCLAVLDHWVSNVPKRLQ